MAGPTMFKKSLQKLKFIFLCTGLFAEMKIRKPFDIIKHRSLYLLNFVWLSSDLVWEIFWIKDGVKSGKNITELTHVAPCFTIVVLAHLKSVSLLVYEKEVHQVVNNIKQLEELEDTRVNGTERDEIIETEISFLNRVINALNVFNILMVLFFYVGPMIFIGAQLIITRDIQEIESKLAMLKLYPFDSVDAKYWPFLFIHQTWVVSMVLLEISAADFLFFTCCTHLRIQFLLLKLDIENLIPLENASGTIKQNDRRANRIKFTDLIMRHQILIASSKLLETTYSKSTLFNFVSSSLMICLTGFNVTTIGDIGMVITFVVFMFMSLLQIFFFCYFGELLMESSFGLSSAAYNCRWYAADYSIRKDLLFVQLRAQNPCRITAYGYADVNLMAFMAILRAAWSYFALLKTIYG